MKPGGGRLERVARAVWRLGPVDRLKRRLEDRFMAVVLDATRLTNDGSYRRYRDDPTSRGERIPGEGLVEGEEPPAGR